MQALTRATRLGSAGLLTAGLLTAAGGAAAVAHAAPACTPYQLPGFADGDGQAEVIVINAAAGLYGGDAVGGDGNWHAAYWTHDGTNPSTGWTIHHVPSPLHYDFVGDINSHGQLVATGTDFNGNGAGYVYDIAHDTVTPLHGLGGGDDYDRRINDAGVVVGTSVDTHGVYHAVTWAPPYTKVNVEPDGGASRSFSSPDSHNKGGEGATGINNKGQVVGRDFNGGHMADTDLYARNHIWHDAVAPILQPMVWQANKSPQRLPTGNSQGAAWAINDAGLIVGNVVDPQTFNARPVAWVNGKLADMGAPADIVMGNAYGLSQGGWAAGGYIEPDDSSRAFTWDTTDGLRTLAPLPGQANSWSHGVSDALQQVGGSSDDGSTTSAVVWQC